MARKIEVEIVGDSRSLERAFKRSEKSATRFQGTMRGVSSSFKGLFAAGGITLGAGLLVKGIEDSVQAASDLNEEVNKSKVVFRRSAVAVKAWSTTTANAFAISQADALSAASNFGLLFRTFARNDQQTAQMSRRFVELAGDLASFFNVSTDDALEKLRAGLAGEARPLREFGVFISEAKVKAEAYRSGIARAGSTLTEAQKIQARYNIIVRESGPAHGDAARTANSFANQQRRLAALIEDTKAKIGQGLLPILSQYVGKLDEWLSKSENQRKLAERTATAMDALAKAFEGAAVGLDQLNAAGEAMDKIPFGKALKWAATTAVPVQLARGIDFLKQGAPGARPPWYSPPPGPPQRSIVPDSWYRQHGLKPPMLKSKVPRSWFDQWGLTRGGTTGGRVTTAPPRGPTATMRNQWFDSRLARQLDRLQDKGLRAQLSGLRALAAEVKARIATTKDATRKLTLEDKYVDILRQERDVQSQITDQIKQANEALKERADAIKSAVLDRLQRQQTQRENQRAISDAKEALRLAKLAGGPMGIRSAQRQLADALLAAKISRVEALPARLTKGGVFSLGNMITINIHGVTDPDKVAAQVVEVLKRRGRRTTTQTRGAHAGANG